MQTRFVIRTLSALGFATLFAACSASSSVVGKTTPAGPNSGSKARHPSDVSPCSTVTTSGGKTYTVAHFGGGSGIDVESSAYANCTIGIYISSAHGPASLDHTVVNGPFGIGIYVDSVGTMHQDHTSICVNGTHLDGTCATGSSSSSGTGLDFWNTPNLSIDHTNIDGYAAGFATNPCPDSANRITDDHTVITNATYPWSYVGGSNNFNFSPGHDSPAWSGGSCSGGGVGAGATFGPEYPISHNAGHLFFGPDGNLWDNENVAGFTGSSQGWVLRITPTGVVTEFPDLGPLGNPVTVTRGGVGPDNHEWFGGSDNNGGFLTRVDDESGDFTYFATTDPFTTQNPVTGADGRLWFAEPGLNAIGAMTLPSGPIANYPVITQNSFPWGLVAGIDGNVWFGETFSNSNIIGKVTTGGVVTEYATPTQNSAPTWFTNGPDGNVWFVEAIIPTPNVARVTENGTITEFTLAPCQDDADYPTDSAWGPDGRLYFTCPGTNQIGVMAINGPITLYTIPTPNSGAYGITVGSDGRIWFDEDNALKVRWLKLN